MKKSLATVAVAILLGIVSPFLVGPNDGPLLRAWFQWLPIQVDQLLLPEGDFTMLVLAMATLTVQYLLVFASAAALLRLLQLGRDFFGTPRHRAGLADYRHNRPANVVAQ